MANWVPGRGFLNDLDTGEEHERGRVSINTLELARQRISADEAANADPVMTIAREIVDVTDAQLADVKFLFGTGVCVGKELVLFRALGAGEKRMSLRQPDGGFQQPRISRIAVARRIASPCERALPF